jgi:hypothetical protein
MQAAEAQLAIIAGDKQEEGIYQLPTDIASAAQAQYEKDVALVHGGPVQSSEAEYKEFLSSLSGPPRPGGVAPSTLFLRLCPI